jgi:hypothetical protein
MSHCKTEKQLEELIDLKSSSLVRFFSWDMVRILSAYASKIRNRNDQHILKNCRLCSTLEHLTALTQRPHVQFEAHFDHTILDITLLGHF